MVRYTIIRVLQAVLVLWVVVTVVFLLSRASGNVAELMARREVDGALVGGASLDPDDFARIVKYAG